ncbi:MAG: YkvI family membrane protein [Mycobacteriaceae bacterium]|uniref:YkvI family membrane protein n=1 Tax=Corynebacterium sp. TaxID=1720 RepID=UPI003F951942
MAFLGVLIGAGFATGNEIIQYFTSFGSEGLWGILVSGALMVVGGPVILALGSYFLAREHNRVFQGIATPVIARLLDIAITFTLFCIGFVMFAGAGANIEQHFDLPAWVGSTVMLGLVMVTGLLDVHKITNTISALTPLLIIAVVIGFVYTLFNLPGDTAALDSLAMQDESPVTPWWLSGANYTGMALALGVSMSLVVGGTYTNLRLAGQGGLIGGVLFSVLLFMTVFTLYMNIDTVSGNDVPTLALFDSMHPVMGHLMIAVILAMIFGTALAMFYSMSARVTAKAPNRRIHAFFLLCLAGYAVSFVGFDTLLNLVYPILGWIGMAMLVVMIGWAVAYRARLTAENEHRNTIRGLIKRAATRTGTLKGKLKPAERRRLKRELDASEADSEELTARIIDEVTNEEQDAPSDDASAPDSGDGDAPDPRDHTESHSPRKA